MPPSVTVVFSASVLRWLPASSNVIEYEPRRDRDRVRQQAGLAAGAVEVDVFAVGGRQEVELAVLGDDVHRAAGDGPGADARRRVEARRVAVEVVAEDRRGRAPRRKEPSRRRRRTCGFSFSYPYQ